MESVPRLNQANHAQVAVERASRSTHVLMRSAVSGGPPLSTLAKSHLHIS